MSSEQTQARLRSVLLSLSQSHQSSVAELTSLLNSVSDSALSDPGDEEAKANAVEALSRVFHFLASSSSSSSLTEEISDALSFELPSVASRFAGVSDECAKIVAELIDWFVSTCNPRDMLSILCEAMAYSGEMVKVGSAYYLPIMRGISKLFMSIKRRHFEQVKSAVPVILNVIKAVSLLPEYEDEDEDLKDIFGEALNIAGSIKHVCTKMEVNVKEKLRALLGLYVLQIMSVATLSKISKAPSSDSFIAQLSSFFPYCDLSYIGLITGYEVNRMTTIVIGESEEDFASCLSYVNHGASLAVIWGYIHDSALQAAEENLALFEDELRKDQIKRWEAIGMLKHLLSLINLPGQLKRQAIDIVLCINSGNIVRNYDNDDDEDSNCSDYVPSLFAALKAVQSVIMFSSDTELRRNAFSAFKKILADIPSMQRFDILKALITNSDSPSMIAILLDIVRSELNMEKCRRTDIEKEKTKAYKPTPFWSSNVLNLIDPVFRPSIGGPPILPEQGESVLSALNLYRFILITESTGQTNYTGVVSKMNLEKAHRDWLLPLRALVMSIMAENKTDYAQYAVDTVCAINPIELVMYRCIDLVEEKLKQSS